MLLRSLARARFAVQVRYAFQLLHKYVADLLSSWDCSTGTVPPNMSPQVACEAAYMYA